MNQPSEAKPTQGILTTLRCGRTVKTLIVSVLLIVGMGMLRPDKPVGMYPNQYWATKIRWRHCADVVLTGDSRTLMALSPAEMQKKLTDRRIFNYGFGANWYSLEYLEAAENVLDPRSGKKTIIMGISPNSLTQKARQVGNFAELRERSKQDAYLDIHFAAIVHFLEPMSFRDAFQGMFPSLAETHTRKEYFADGWMAVNKEPAGGRNEVKRYRKIYEQNQVSDRTIENVISYVSKWTNSGIRVYGFPPPSSREMVEMEKDMSGLNEAEFVAAFRKAGGMWIPVDQSRYASFDGSHLEDDAALQFSRDLALRIGEFERLKPATATRN